MNTNTTKLAQALRNIVSVTSATPSMTEQQLGIGMGRIQEIAEAVLSALAAHEAQQEEPIWTGAAPFIQHAQNAAGSAGAEGHWPDEFLSWYKPDDWFGEHRAAAVFLGMKFASMAQQVPAGMVLVPVELTDDMLANVDEEVGGHCHSCSKWNASWDDCRRVWAAMLAAAPKQAEPAGLLQNDEEHPNNRLIFKWLCALAGIELGKDKISDAVHKVTELRQRLTADPVAAEPAHPDDLAVDRFAARMKWKLGQKRNQGRSGWQDRAWTPEMISQALREHVDKGDPLDVANYCMFLAARNEPIHPAPQPVREPMTWQPIETAPHGEMLLFADMKAVEARHWIFCGWRHSGLRGGSVQMPDNTARSGTHWMPLPEAPGITKEGA